MRTRTSSAAIGGSLSGQDYNKDVYIPLSTFRSRIGDRVFTRMSGTFSAEQVELNQITSESQKPRGRCADLRGRPRIIEARSCRQK